MSVARLNNVNIAFMSHGALPRSGSYSAVHPRLLYAVINAHIAVRGILDLIFRHLKRVPQGSPVQGS